jgi:hypothetical protein
LDDPADLRLQFKTQDIKDETISIQTAREGGKK